MSCRANLFTDMSRRILIIEPAGGLWGSERALLDLIDAAPELEFAVCCPPATPLIAELERRGVRVLPYLIERLHEKSRWHRLLAALGVIWACIVYRPAIIHLNQSGVYRLCLPAARLLGLGIVCHVRIFEDAAFLADCRPNHGELKAIIAISGAIESELACHSALAAIPVVRIYDAFVSDCPTPPDNFPRPRRIVCVGRIVPIKGQELLIQALGEVDLLPADVECRIVGDGEAALVDRLETMGGDRVEWTGFVGQVSTQLTDCAVLACPSHREPLGRVVFEAWAAGAIPVVYAGGGGAAEAVAAAGGGVVYAEQTPRGLAAGLAKALALPPIEAARLIANGRAWLQENCSPGPYGKSIANVLLRY